MDQSGQSDQITRCACASLQESRCRKEAGGVRNRGRRGELGGQWGIIGAPLPRWNRATGQLVARQRQGRLRLSAVTG